MSRLLLLTFGLLSIGGCATSGADAPLPTWAAALGPAATERLITGRSLFSTRCQRCHALPAPDVKSSQEWPGEVAAMSKKSGLSAEQTALVTEYLVAASRAARGDRVAQMGTQPLSHFVLSRP